MRFIRPVVVLACVVSLAACAPPEEPHGIGMATNALSGTAARRARAAQIRDAAFDSGIEQGWLMAGIASAETLLSHCASEYDGAKCYGPNSSDCAGGPVLAGYWDVPGGGCAGDEGGLGMFQFDSGNHNETLDAYGTDILTVAGNVQEAIEFVIRRLIFRSGRNNHPVAGIDTRAEAIDWLNGVRIDNGRFPQWIDFITQYYNGCLRSYSCYDSRYAHYRDHARNIYDEMGAAFWEVNNDWSASYEHQTFPLASQPFEIPAGAEVSGYIELRNEGVQTWTPGSTFLGTTEPRDGESPIAASDWVSPSRAATVDAPTAPGEVGRFSFSVRAPDELGDYPQFFNLVEEGVAWFSSPPDDQLQVKVTSIANDCGAVGEAWECDGNSRRRCHGGALEVETCTSGSCSGGVCMDAPSADGGMPVSDGGVTMPGPDGGDPTLGGGCAVGGASASERWAGAATLPLLLALVALRARRRAR